MFAKHSVAQAEWAIAEAKQSSEQSLAQSERVAQREHDNETRVCILKIPRLNFTRWRQSADWISL
jgi:hypothetical protein